MNTIIIRVAGYTDTVSVYVNDSLLRLSSALKDAKYTYEMPQGICQVRIIKNSSILNKKWRKKVALNWLSCLSGIPDFTFREAVLETMINSICFNIPLTQSNEVIDINVSLNSSGFSIDSGDDKCNDIICENKTDSLALKRVRLFYYLPSILLLFIIASFLLLISVLLLIKGKYKLFLIVLGLILLLSILFVYLIKKSK
jgi:hypothetical protein